MITVLHRSCPGTDYNVHIIQCRIVRCQIVRVPNRPTIHWIHLNTASLHIGWWYVLWDFFLSFESKIEIPGAELWCSNIPCLLAATGWKGRNWFQITIWMFGGKKERAKMSQRFHLCSKDRSQAKPIHWLPISIPMHVEAYWQQSAFSKNLDHEVSVYFGRLHK